MKYHWRLSPVLLLAAALIACSGKSGSEDGKQNSASGQSGSAIAGTVFRPDASLTISSPQGNLRASYTVEIAATPDAVSQGLMWREAMDSGQGMLFDPQGLSQHPFWMKNTYLPLDILFIDDERRILHIATHTQPFSEDLIEPGDIYRWVLELNAGQTQQHQISIGDKVQWTSPN